MKEATLLWKQYIEKKITAKEAVERLNILFAGASGPDTAKLSGIYQKIIDAEVPMEDRNTDAEEAFWKRTHKEEENE